MKKEEIIKILQQSYPEEYTRFLNFKKQGINFDNTQMHMMFLPRRYGKTFMSYCRIAEKVKSTREKYVIDLDSPLLCSDKLDITYITYTDCDLVDNKGMKSSYVDGLFKFLLEYYPEIKCNVKFRRKIEMEYREYL